MIWLKVENKRKKLIIIVSVLLFIVLITLFFRYLYFNTVRTDERVMKEVELIERKDIIKNMLNENKEYRTQEMLDILWEYSGVIDKITVDDDFDYVIVKQQYKIDKKLGWMPVGIPETQIFRITD